MIPRILLMFTPCLALLALQPPAESPERQMESLDRGVVAIVQGEGEVFLS